MNYCTRDNMDVVNNSCGLSWTPIVFSSPEAHWRLRAPCGSLMVPEGCKWPQARVCSLLVYVIGLLLLILEFGPGNLIGQNNSEIIKNPMFCLIWAKDIT